MAFLFTQRIIFKNRNTFLIQFVVDNFYKIFKSTCDVYPALTSAQRGLHVAGAQILY